MATTEYKANTFVKAVEDAAQAAMEKLEIDKADILMRVEIDIQSVKRSDFPKEG
jgi:hypothetical protein